MHGLVVQKVEDDGPVAELLNGAENDSPDIILSAEDQPVRTVEDLRNALKHPGPGGIVTLIVYNPRFGTQGARRVVRVQLKYGLGSWGARELQTWRGPRVCGAPSF